MDKIDRIDDWSYKWKIEYWNVFRNLCEKSQQLIFMYNRIEPDAGEFLNAYELCEYLEYSSPIEQVFALAFDLYKFHCIEQQVNFLFDSEKTIKCNNKNYKAPIKLINYST